MNRKTWSAILLLQVAICFLFIGTLVTNNRVTQFASSTQAMLGKTKGQDGVSPIVDYEKIDQMITEKIHALPKPQDGRDGRDGVNTTVEKNILQVVTAPGGKGDKGDQGDPGVAIQKVELRANPITHETEWRCSGDLLWTSLVSVPVLEDSCL